MRTACPRCGRPADEGLCPECLLETASLIDSPGAIEVTVCSVCGARKVRGRWTPHDGMGLEDLVSQEVIGGLGIHRELEDPKVSLDLRRIGATSYTAEVAVSGTFRGQAAEQRCEVSVRIRQMACDRCSRIAGGYFQSTVQVRGNRDRGLTKEEIEESKRIAVTLAESEYRGGDQLSFIQDIREVRGGLDMLLGSTKLGRHLARALQDRFGGRVLESCKLVGRRDSRDLYRSTILVRLPRLRLGDVVSRRGELLEVVGFDGRDVLVSSIPEGRRSMLTEEGSGSVEILGNRADARSAVVVAMDQDVLEILDPDTFQTVLAPRPRSLRVGPGEEVTVVRTVHGFLVLG
ncbi:MAG: 60S ribosomal export protein NMD3 [Methanothrix sp.]|nr:60S ribosomal export protein NMD3 [Methanothrix sp.]